MNIEKMREDFKLWAMKDFCLREGHFVEEDGEFANYPTHCYWLVWQASRAAIEVELPGDSAGLYERMYGGTTPEGDELYRGDEIIGAIESLGLKVKS